ncbi:HNH endonuclease [Pycnococcus provasolii]
MPHSRGIQRGGIQRQNAAPLSTSKKSTSSSPSSSSSHHPSHPRAMTLAAEDHDTTQNNLEDDDDDDDMMEPDLCHPRECSQIDPELQTLVIQALAGRRTLVLDISYQPVRVVGWKQAICLDVLDKVDVLEYYDNPSITTPKEEYLLPAVVRTRHINRRPRGGLVPLTRKNLLLRDRHSCQYCGCRGSGDGSPERTKRGDVALTIDHVIPVSKGGIHDWTNCVIACSACNAKKGNLMPKDAAKMKGLKLNIKPHQPRLEELYSVMTFRPRRAGAPQEWLSWLPDTCE